MENEMREEMMDQNVEIIDMPAEEGSSGLDAKSVLLGGALAGLVAGGVFLHKKAKALKLRAEESRIEKMRAQVDEYDKAHQPDPEEEPEEGTEEEPVVTEENPPKKGGKKK